MLEKVTSIATAASAVGCGITAGVLLAFSVSVMPALRDQQPSVAMSSMQKMNVAIVSPVFMTVFLGSALAATVAAVAAWMSSSDTRVLIAVGAAVFVVGCFVVTIVVNVPLNDALAAADSQSADGLRTWSDYLTTWTRWNHARTVAAAGACALLTFAARR